MYEIATIFISGITVIFGMIGVLLFVKLMYIWNQMDRNLIKARFFLSDKFIMKNIVIIFFVGLLIAFHNFFEYMGLGQPDFYYGNITPHFPTRLIAVTELFVGLLLIEWLMYQWIKISKKN